MAIESKRGCGYRKVGGLYLVSGSLGESCHRLPWKLDICPTCHGGIKQTLGWTWVDGEKLLAPACEAESGHCNRCPVCKPLNLKKAGLLWVGRGFYKTPESFVNEVLNLGLSKRIGAIPRDFKLGQTWVLLAHPKAVKTEEGYAAGIFQVFMPTRIETLIRESDATPERLEMLERRSITPIIVPDNDPDHQGTVYDKKPKVGHE